MSNRSSFAAVESRFTAKLRNDCLKRRAQFMAAARAAKAAGDMAAAAEWVSAARANNSRGVELRRTWMDWRAQMAV